MFAEFWILHFSLSHQLLLVQIYKFIKPNRNISKKWVNLNTSKLWKYPKILEHEFSNQALDYKEKNEFAILLT